MLVFGPSLRERFSRITLLFCTGLGTLTILPDTLTIQAGNDTVAYGTAPIYASTITGYQYSDSDSILFTDSLIYSPTSSNNIAPGIYPIVPGGLQLVQPSNYVLNYQNGVLDVTPPLAVCNSQTVYLDPSGKAVLDPLDINGSMSVATRGVSMSLSQAIFDCSNLGTMIDTLTVVDGYGDTSSCLSAITGTHSTPPVAISQPVTVQLNAAGIASVTAAQINNGSYDNCSIASMSVSPDSFTCLNVGTNTVILTVTDSSGNSSTASSIVTVQYNLPAATISGSAIVCENSAAPNITFTGTGGTAPYTFTYNIGGGNNVAITSTGNSATVAVATNAAGAYTYNLVSVQDAATAACAQAASGSATITVNANPIVRANTTAISVCEGHSVTLTGSGAVTYTWNNGVINGISFVPASSNTYTVTGTDGNQCSSTASVSVDFNLNPTVTANASAASVCAGNSVTLTGGGASIYNWSNSATDGLPFVPAGTNTYTVTGTDDNQCSATATVSVIVNTNPTVTANSTSVAVCEGQSVTLTGGGAVTYTWNNGVINGISFVPASSNTYTVTGSDGSQCSATASVSVDFNLNPTVTANASAALVCVGNSVTLTGGGASIYNWSNSATDGLPFVPAGTNTYTVTGTDDNQCSATATVSVIVNTNPTVTANSTSVAVCEGQSVTLTGGGAVTYTWNNGVINGISFVPASSNTYTVTGSDGNQCSATASVSVGFNLNPIVTANASAASVCAGNSVTLTGGGASIYNWSNSATDGLPFVPAGTNTYTVTGTDDNQCSATATVSVIVNTNPTVTANNTSVAVCEGQSVTLTGGGAVTYTWNNGVINGISFVPASSNTYTVTGSDGNQCSATASVSVGVNSNPIVTANASAASVCAGNSVTLTGGGASIYNWSNSATDGLPFVPAGTNTYTVTGTDDNQCSATATVSVIVNTNPTVTANSTAVSVCAGNSLTLSGGGAVTYTWNNGVVNGISFVPVSSNTYVVTGTDGNQCSATASVSVGVNSNPIVTANTSAASVCAGNSVTLTGAGATIYVWSNSATNGLPFVPAGTSYIYCNRN